MNNGPWGTGMIPGYTSWSAKTGQVTTDPNSSFNPMTYQQKYGSNQNAAPAVAPAIDWSKLFSQQKAPTFANVSTGIEAGPVYTQPQVDKALGRYNEMKPRDGNATANALYGQYANQARVGTDRSMALANANQQLGSETARAGAGVRWGQQSAANSFAADQFNTNKNQQVMTLLGALGIF